jgi:hypothetical protein
LRPVQAVQAAVAVLLFVMVPYPALQPVIVRGQEVALVFPVCPAVQLLALALAEVLVHALQS